MALSSTPYFHTLKNNDKVKVNGTLSLRGGYGRASS